MLSIAKASTAASQPVPQAGIWMLPVGPKAGRLIPCGLLNSFAKQAASQRFEQADQLSAATRLRPTRAVQNTSVGGAHSAATASSTSVGGACSANLRK